MIKSIIGLMTATTVSAVLLSQGTTIANSIDVPKLRQEIGISDVVYNCAQDVLSGYTKKDLLTLVNNSDKVGTAAETDTQAALRECVMQDPFGWGPDLTPDELIALSDLKGTN
jgi:hypothetical protein